MRITFLRRVPRFRKNAISKVRLKEKLASGFCKVSMAQLSLAEAHPDVAAGLLTSVP
jgi:hypothetical protein